jgi:hypothetical protein
MDKNTRAFLTYNNTNLSKYNDLNEQNAVKQCVILQYFKNIDFLQRKDILDI